MVSADFGQTHDHTAVAVTERVLSPVGAPYNASIAEPSLYARYALAPAARRIEARQDVEQTYHLVRLDRVPLRTPYTKIAKGLANLVRQLGDRHRRSEGLTDAARVTVGLAIDEGGVGKAVRDILARELEAIPRDEVRVRFVPVTVHGGSNTTAGNGWVHVPKRDLVGAGLVAFQDGRLKVGRLAHRATLEEELANYRLKQNLATGNVAFEPLREGQHDDLVFAVCLGVWAWEHAVRKVHHVPAA